MASETSSSVASVRSRDSELSPLEKLILIRALAPPKKGLGRSDFDKPLEGIAATKLSPGEWRESLDGALQSLVTGGLLLRKRYELTNDGRHLALRFLGLNEKPSRCQWKDIKKRYLIARTIGETGVSPIGKEVGRADKLRAIVAAQATKATTLSADSLREALLRRWFENDLGSGGRSKETLEKADGQPAPAGTATIDLEQFAEVVLEAARDCPTGRFGDSKVFIGHVRDFLGRSKPELVPSREVFDRRLVQAAEAGFVELSRADLVREMNPDDVRNSEIDTGYERYNFIRF